jgi:3-demethoxyubiquinol 3-hydroxylase
MTPRAPQFTDRWVLAADAALRTLAAPPRAQRQQPLAVTRAAPRTELTPADRELAGALMRVNHVGEVCAQALYSGQAAAAQTPALRMHLEEAAQEETDHLAWTQARLDALGARPSLLNPLWYAGSFALGYAAGRISPQVSLGFVVETERQVEAHLQSHLALLPQSDVESRAVVEAMKVDEAKHGQEAIAAGAQELPAPAKLLMRAAAKLMTTVAHRI